MRAWFRRTVEVLRSRRNENGMVLVIASFQMMTMIAVSALIIDIGNLRQETRRAQAAADAAALAGAQEFNNSGAVDWTQVVVTVKNYAEFNFGTTPSSWTGCLDSEASAELGPNMYRPDPQTQCISADHPTNPEVLRVKLPKSDINTFFGKALGQTSFAIGRSASAISANQAGDCIICVLDDTGSSFSITGSSASVSVTNTGNPESSRGIGINSSAANALHINGSAAQITSPSTRIVGGVSTIGSLANIDAPPETGVGPILDPLAGVATPSSIVGPAPGSNHCTGGGQLTYSAQGAGVRVSGSNSRCTINPGVYNQVQAIGSNAEIYLNPGVYVFKSDLSATGSNALIRGDAVMLYFACSAYPQPCSAGGQSGAAIGGSGSSFALELSPPTSGPYEGMSIFYDRNNTSNLSVIGSNAGSFTGTVYARSSTMNVTGSNAGAAGRLNSLLVVNRISVSGSNAGISIEYNEANNSPTPRTTNLFR